MAGLVIGALSARLRTSEWDATRFATYDEGSDSDDDEHAAPERAVTGQSPVPAEWMTAPSAPQLAAPPAAPLAAVGAAAARPAPPAPPPELLAAQPRPVTTGDWAPWAEVGRDLQADLGRREALRLESARAAQDQRTAQQLGLRQADVKDYELAKAALLARGGAERLAERGGVEMGVEDAKAFLWSHLLVPNENDVLEGKQHLLYMQTDGSNPYTNYRENAGQRTVFAMPTAGDSATLETGFVDIVPKRAMQQRVGIWTDPRTNIVSEVYEDLPPPAQGDWSTPPELRDADRDNRMLVMLQGGWDPRNPPPPRREWEADQPLPESQNGDAAYTLPRRERELQAIRPDIANNKGQMFDQAEIDRYPDGFVGYQNERAYASLLAPIPATLRGQPGSEWEMGDRETVDMNQWGPGRAVSDAALGCAAAVSAGDRSYTIDRAQPTPVGLHELRLDGSASRYAVERSAPARAPPSAQAEVAAPGTRGQPTAPARRHEPAHSVPIGRAVAAVGGATGVAIGATAVRDLPFSSDARDVGVTRGAASVTMAATGREAVRDPALAQVAHAQVRVAHAVLPPSAAAAAASEPARRTAEAPTASVFPTHVSIARVPAGVAPTMFQSAGLASGAPTGREDHSAHSARVVRADGGLVARGVAPSAETTLRADDHALRPTGVAGGSAVVVARPVGAVPTQAPRHADAAPAPQPTGGRAGVAAGRAVPETAEAPHSAREHAGAYGGASGAVVAAAAHAAPADTRAHDGLRFMPDRTVAAHPPRDLSRHGARLVPQRADERPERPSSRRSERPDVFNHDAALARPR